MSGALWLPSQWGSRWASSDHLSQDVSDKRGCESLEAGMCEKKPSGLPLQSTQSLFPPLAWTRAHDGFGPPTVHAALADWVLGTRLSPSPCGQCEESCPVFSEEQEAGETPFSPSRRSGLGSGRSELFVSVLSLPLPWFLHVTFSSDSPYPSPNPAQ